MTDVQVPRREQEIAERLQQLCLVADCNEVALLMIERLDIALNGTSWARDASPRNVWEQLLHEVQRHAGITPALTGGGRS